jgi:hypothetical protein
LIVSKHVCAFISSRDRDRDRDEGKEENRVEVERRKENTLDYILGGKVCKM